MRDAGIGQPWPPRVFSDRSIAEDGNRVMTRETGKSRPIVFLGTPQGDAATTVPPELREWEAAVIRYAELKEDIPEGSGGSCAFSVSGNPPEADDSKVDYTLM